MAPSRTAKTPNRMVKSPKTKAPQNASILSFFKKTPLPEESLFVRNKNAPPVDSFIDVEHSHGDEPAEDRYNETPIAVKRLKLCDADKDANGMGRGDGSGVVGTTTPPNGEKRKARKGPFLDDSDSEDSSPLRDPEKQAESSSSKEQDKQLSDIRPIWTPKEAVSGADSIPRDANLVPNLPNECSVDEDFGEFADMGFPDEDDFEEGEEHRERRFMEEQARLEAEEAAVMEDSVMAECCPICNASLAGTSADEATAHVNACLDGNPVAQPTRTRDQESLPPKEQIAAEQMPKRFARAAQPRPGQANPINIGAGSSTATAKSAFTKLMSSTVEDAAWTTAAFAESAERGRPAYQRTCPFYKIMPGLFICVDAFRYGAVEGCRAYFLSHFHSDHYIGLTASWRHGPIYCSKATGSLVKSQLKTAGKWVIELEFEETVEIPDTEGVRVTMIPANHCPGSSLFLFEKTMGRAANGGDARTQRILHCGDFRACPAHVDHARLRPDMIDAVTGKTKQQKIDVCYLDTTYLNPRYSFPPQEDVITACTDMCVELNRGLRDGDQSRWERALKRRGGSGAGNEKVSKFFTRNNSDPPRPTGDTAKQPPDALTALGKPRLRLLVVCGTYKIGKERICKAIALALNSKIYAPPSKIRVVAQLGDPELAALMTSNPTEAQVHMQMLMEMRAETLTEYLESYRPHFSCVVGLRPSGWNYRPAMANNGGSKAAAVVGANLTPSQVPMTTLLHGPGWRTRFSTADLVPQRGSTRDALCFGVPYSEHSSFRQLALLIMGLRIERIVPTVNVGSELSRRRMKGWLDRWMSERRRGGIVRIIDGEEGEVGPERRLWEGKDGRGGGAYW